jgi:CDP-diacylglycerol--glycerol-3-phosphate 3-phosphatidyltransferase
LTVTRKKIHGKHSHVNFPIFSAALIHGIFHRTCQNFLAMTTANKITILRILLTPFFVVEVLYYVKTGNEIYRLLAIISFAVAAICDGVDGYIARHYNQISELGKILDPLADKLLLVSAVVLLSFDNTPYLRPIPLWLTGTIIGRDLLILVGVGVIHFTVGKIKVRPRILGKCATVLQMAVVIWVLLKWDFGHGGRWYFFCAIAAALCTGISGLFYVFDGIKQLGAHPSSSATEK